MFINIDFLKTYFMSMSNTEMSCYFWQFYFDDKACSEQKILDYMAHVFGVFQTTM